MAIQTFHRVPLTSGRGGPSASYAEVCRFWLAGKCNRNPCKFRHTEVPQINTYQYPVKLNTYQRTMKLSSPKIISKTQNTKRGLGSRQPKSLPKPKGLTYVLKSQETENMLKSQETENMLKSQETENMLKSQETQKMLKPQETLKMLKPQETQKIFKTQSQLCQDWASGTCTKGEKCIFLHSWCQCQDFTLLANLQEHKKGIVGIGLPSGSDKLYSGSKDGTIRLWDCHTGECTRVVKMGQEIHSLVCEDSWIFIGLLNAIKAWNVHNGATFELEASIGQVCAMTTFNDLCFAGGQTGDILVWRGSSETSSSLPLVAVLKGHTQPVTTLIIGANRLFSCSVDGTIKVWEIDNFTLVETLEDHTGVVTSVLCWDHYLLSSSLDQTIKVWGLSDTGKLEVIYTHTLDQGVLSLKGMHDEQGKPVLLCGLNDNSMHVYDLPTFMERGIIFSKQEVSAIGVSTNGGLFFTGDGCGDLKVWKWSHNKDNNHP